MQLVIMSHLIMSEKNKQYRDTPVEGLKLRQVHQTRTTMRTLIVILGNLMPKRIHHLMSLMPTSQLLIGEMPTC